MNDLRVCAGPIVPLLRPCAMLGCRATGHEAQTPAARAGDAYRGRVMSLIVMVSRGLTSASQVQTGVATALLGAPGAATIGAVAIVGTIAAAATRGKALRDFTAPGPRRQVPQVAPTGGES